MTDNIIIIWQHSSIFLSLQSCAFFIIWWAVIIGLFELIRKVLDDLDLRKRTDMYEELQELKKSK